jgi:gluconolactonase
LLFTQIVAPTENQALNRVMRYGPKSGDVEEVRKFTYRTVGLARSDDGLLYGSQSMSRRIVKFESDGSATVPTYKLGGEYLNEPQDLLVDSQGRVWFADPVQNVAGMPPQFQSRVAFASVNRISAPPSEYSVIQRMTFDTNRPWAVALSRDEQTLYVSENGVEAGGARQLRAYPILADGTLGNYELLASFGSDARGAHAGVSGMCVDSEGNIVACAGGSASGPGPMVYVYSPEGRPLDAQPVPEGEPTNCAFGGADLSTLFVTTNDGRLYAVRDSGRKG